MKIIPLTQGKEAWIDDEDYILVRQYNWHYNIAKHARYGYAITNISNYNNQTSLYMHTLIMNPSEGFIIDHKDHNGCNNQRTNLRICTRTQDRQNQSKRKRSTSQYKGVSFDKSKDKWRTDITINGITIYLGANHNEIAAAELYDLAAKLYFGEFACLNFPEN